MGPVEVHMPTWNCAEELKKVTFLTPVPLATYRAFPVSLVMMSKRDGNKLPKQNGC